MSIVTRTGDDGSTGLMFNRRVSKSHPRVEAYGSVDELNAALGMARASCASFPLLAVSLLTIQRDLVVLMGELATLPEDLPRYFESGKAAFTESFTQKLEAWVKEIEGQKISFNGWATPGDSLASGSLDVARTVCRRAERRIQDLREQRALDNHEISVFLNRLSDLLWLMARWVETQTAARSMPG